MMANETCPRCNGTAIERPLRQQRSGRHDCTDQRMGLPRLKGNRERIVRTTPVYLPLKMRLALPAVLAAALVGSAPAIGYNMIGSGTDSCGTWTALRHQSEPAAMQPGQWILGFLSGVGYMDLGELDPLNRMDARAVWAWVDDYCLTHSRESIARAGAAFVTAHPR
jgi:hypothetical protein